ncbi:MAG: hypothetical protein KDB69_07330 [Acidimicrobiia bacterium]|nr:hypothetical protein [Acidimicrobiia bacterium]
MTNAFAGTVLLPGEDGDGLAAVLQTESETEDVRLSAGEEELGSWRLSDTKIEPVGKGVFSVKLGGEQILFTPQMPAQFAEALTVPLQPEPAQTTPSKSSVRKDEKARMKREKSDAKVAKERASAMAATQEKEVLGKGLTVAVVGLSAAVAGALVAISVTL